MHDEKRRRLRWQQWKFWLYGDDYSDDDENYKTMMREDWRECVRKEKNRNVWWQIDWSHVNEAKSPKERTVAAWWRKKRARMDLMYYTIYMLLCVAEVEMDGCVYTSRGNLIRVWHFRQIGGNLKVLLGPSSTPSPPSSFPMVAALS